MSDATAVFIDGGYLQKVLKDEFNSPRIDFTKLAKHLAGGEMLRTYYYNCPPYQSDPPTQKERELKRNADRFYNRLRDLEDFELRLGKLAYRGEAKNGGALFVQKQIDIMLAIDIVMLATKGSIKRAIVLTGDSDLLPAIQVAKDEGVKVVLVHGTSHAAHHELIQASDRTIRLDQSIMKDARNEKNAT